MEQELINKIVKVLLKQYNYSDINVNIEDILKTETPFWTDCVKAALAAIQEEYVLVKKDNLNRVIFTALAGDANGIDAMADAVEKALLDWQLTKKI